MLVNDGVYRSRILVSLLITLGSQNTLLTWAGGRRFRRRVVRTLLTLAPLIAFFCLIFVDFASLYLYTWRKRCEVEVFDTYGYVRGVVEKCYYDRLELRDYMHLGASDAKVIVIATHYFTSPQGEVGLGTSERAELYYPLLHPIRALQAVRGVIQPGVVYVAAPPRVFSASNLTGKVVILLTCKLPRIEEVVNALIDGGAHLVIVSNTPVLRPSELRYLLELVLQRVDNPDELCALKLFTCYGGFK